MRLELARELRDAGFPQNNSPQIWLHVVARTYKSGQGWVKRPDSWKLIYSKDPLTFSKNEWIANPTLERLIAECGEGDFRLARYGELWCAELRSRSVEEPIGQSLNYPTPEEAVAYLYLVL